MILEHWKYRDPLEGLIEQESRSCKGCKHLDAIRIAGQLVQVCKKGKNPIKRCKKYQEEE